MNSFRKAVLSGKGSCIGDRPAAQQAGARRRPRAIFLRSRFRAAKPAASDHRENDRHRLAQETATVRYEGEEHRVDLINLSGGGAMIRADFAPRLWERVDLVFGEGAEIECAVRWLRDDRVGLEFAHETRIDCSPERRDALLLDVIRRSFGEVRFPRQSQAARSPAAVADDDDAVANSRRTERRHPLVWVGHVLYNHGSEKVRLRNISENGALIECPIGYPLGSEIYLDLDDAGQHFATVNWTCGDKIGLRFQVPFDLKLLSKSKPELASALMARPGPSQIYADQDNPWAEGWAAPIARRASRRPRRLSQALDFTR